jgi:uncharacterized protein with HEPN domain
MARPRCHLGAARAGRPRSLIVGEERRALDLNLVPQEPEIAAHDAAGRRDRSAHHDFDTAPTRIEITIIADLPPLEAAVLWLHARCGLAEDGAP